jgi:predicted ATPase
VASEAPIEFRVLGPLEVWRNGTAVQVGGGRQGALLALLLLSANEVVSRPRAVDFLWPEGPPERAVNAIQVGVHGLRRALGAARIETRGTGYVLKVDPDELDLFRFVRLHEAGRAALAAGDAATAADALGRALALWRGEPLADVTVPEVERAGLDELRLGTLELHVEAELALGGHDAVVGELEALIGRHPFRERLRAHLMVALYRAGRQADALEAYQSARRALADELGIEPSPALRELERAILRQDPSLDLPADAGREAHLPRPATRLVGRRLDVASACALLSEPDIRLLTLTGAGGVGKTRLAIEVAAELSSELEHGAVFVDLAPLTDAAQVEPTVAAVLGVVAQPGRTAREQLVARLRGRELLLVLDNFERLLDAASLVVDLLAASPRLRVLVTSRTPLRLAGEHEYQVPPLAVPDASDDAALLARNDSVSVFVARARALERDFRLGAANATAVSAICRKLGGLPLALELAAARVNVLTVEQILDRLVRPLELLTGGGRDLPARQQTLRATIDWSHELLDPERRSLFARLAVFAGGCTLRAAEEVCDAGLESFAGLIDTGLLSREQPAGGEPRFTMLDTVREYALEQLGERGSDTRERHARYFASLAESNGPELVGRQSLAAVDRIAPEHENLRAALGHALDRDVELGFRIAAALRPYWDIAHRGREIRIWLERALGQDPSPTTQAQVGALVVLGKQLLNDGEYERAAAAFETAADAGRRLGAEEQAAVALTYLAWLRAAVGDYEECLQRGEEAVELARRQGHVWAERQGLAMVAGALINLGRPDAARRRLARSLELARGLGDVNTVVVALTNSGYGAICAGDLTGARALLEEALRLDRGPEPSTATVGVLHLLAWEANLSGDADRAPAFLREAIGLLDVTPQLVHRIDVVTEAAVTLRLSAPHTAARLVGAAEAARAQRGIQTAVPTTRRQAELRARLAAELGTDEFDAAHVEGMRLELDEAVAEARAALDGTT